MKRPLIQVKNLSKDFGHTRALNSLSFRVSEGEKILLLGPNGAGKSTLIRIIAGLISPSSGEVTFHSVAAARRRRNRARLIGYVGHNCMLYEELTAEENLRFYGSLYGLKSDSTVRRTADLLQMVEMTAHSTSLVRELSQGQRKRISIARAMMHDPPFLLLDEPFSALDSQARAWLTGFLQDTEDKTILMVTHQPEQDFPMARRAIAIAGGELADDRQLDGTGRGTSFQVRRERE